MRKAIKRATKHSAYNAMQKHINIMQSKGWKVDNQFAGDAGLQFEYITYFYR